MSWYDGSVGALVGRDRELALLDDIVAARDGVVLVTGEPGIGKTRILQELARRVIGGGGAAAWGRMWEVGETPAFWPWLQLLAALEQVDDRAPVLASIDAHGDATARLARFAEVARFLGRRAAVQPLALLFDDVHLADPSSLQLLEFVVPLLGERVVFALAARDGDSGPERSAVLSRIARGAHRLPLGRLRREHVAELVGDRANVERVFELSAGNPLFVEELVAAGGEGLPAFSGVRAVIRERIARLPAPTRAIAEAAAVLGREFRGAVAGELAGASDPQAALQPLTALGMVAMTHPDRYRFSHALIAEAIAGELDPSERARLHLRAAHALEARAADPSTLAHHLLAAGLLAAEAAVTAAERAAQQAMAQLAFEDAAGLLERALHALALAAPADRRRRAVLACAQAEALQHASQHARALAVCDEASAIARELGDRELLARIVLVRGLELRFGQTDARLVAAIRDVIDDDIPVPIRARLLARLAAAEQPAADPMGPVTLAREAIALAAGSTGRDRLEVLYVASAALIDYVPTAELAPLHAEVQALAHALGDRWISIHARLRLCFLAIDRIDRPAFDAAVAAFRTDAAELGLPRWQHHADLLAALTALLDGDFAAAELAADRAAANALGDAHATWLVKVHRAFSARLRTAPPDEHMLELAAPAPHVRGPLRVWFAHETGDLAATRDALAALAELPRDPDMLAIVACAIAFAGERAAAERAYEHVLPRAGTIFVAGAVGTCVVDLFDRVLLLLATATERWDAIDDHAERAIAIANRLASPPWLARVRGDWATALDRRGRPGDAARARALRDEARTAGERLGMPRLAAHFTKQPVPVAPPRTILELARTGELWTVRGFGETVHVKSSRGLEMLAKLVAVPHQPLHALELAGARDPVDGGDAGPQLDAQAKAEYRARLRELVGDRDAAEAANDAGRLARIQHELEALTSELERAVGLGGRDRKAGAASERARSNVQRRIAHAIDQICAGSARLGEHLAATIETGTYCCYRPAPAA